MNLLTYALTLLFEHSLGRPFFESGS